MKSTALGMHITGRRVRARSLNASRSRSTTIADCGNAAMGSSHMFTW